MWQLRWIIKPIVFAACLAPALRLIAGVLNATGVAHIDGISLGADPVKVMLHTCGRWTLNFLMITLCMTPLKDLTHSVFWLRFRRMFGLFALFYVLLHFSVYLLLDQSGKLGELWQDIVKRPYITIGMLGLLLLIPLGLTSTAKAQRRLGRRWTQLHRLVYVIATLGVWHFWWQVKKDIREPLLYVCGLTLLLGYRLWKHRRSLAQFSAARIARTDAA
ncbi:MAG TPA: protein-methionine-sulfoxide reductase heme-binding subunit MsrQ [Steroidobacteraceae bacterium]|nr:protein-methionine-sulfoxide reductase heme-binding subunit MsrQ [Steroidobacteraceae bacterium]